MRVEVAQTAGFCFGVDRAVSTVYRLLEEGKKRKEEVDGR